MKAKTCEIAAYSFSSNDNLLLDANIWLFLYGPTRPRDRRVSIYSRAYQKIMTAGCNIFFDVLVVSEIINTWARINHKIKAPGKKFKDYRQTADFKAVAKDISIAVGHINKVARRINDGFDTLDFDNLLKDYSQGQSDFNDQILAELCKNSGFKMVTDDGDFKKADIFLLTANPNLLTV